MAAITLLDLNWTGRPRSIAACLLDSDGHTALVDPGPASTLETLRAQLRSRGLAVADLSAVLLTHIHLDHAAATGALLRENPGLPVYVHKLGAPHLADPGKLLASATRLYGENMQRLFGDVLPVPQENLRILEGGETLAFGTRKLDVVYTPGHASHHVSYFDSLEGVAFIGDTGGIRIQGQALILPATPPPDINMELWNASLDAIAARRPARLLLTHFGFVRDAADHIARYRERLREWTALSGELLRTHADEAAAARAFVEQMEGEIMHALPTAEAAHYIFNGGLDLSWMGLARYWRKRTEAAQAPRSR
jgi:glyoxylase-like metal-dependent hydrolase (beta-lactamase superfamily II)